MIATSDGEILHTDEQQGWLSATEFFSDWFQLQTVRQIRCLLERDGLASMENAGTLSCVENSVLRLLTADDQLIDLHIDPCRARFAIVLLLSDAKAPRDEEWCALRDDCLFRDRNVDMGILGAWNITRKAREVMQRCACSPV